jgi:hypothetical protein
MTDAFTTPAQDQTPALDLSGRPDFSKTMMGALADQRSYYEGGGPDERDQKIVRPPLGDQQTPLPPLKINPITHEDVAANPNVPPSHIALAKAFQAQEAALPGGGKLAFNYYVDQAQRALTDSSSRALPRTTQELYRSWSDPGRLKAEAEAMARNVPETWWKTPTRLPQWIFWKGAPWLLQQPPELLPKVAHAIGGQPAAELTEAAVAAGFPEVHGQAEAWKTAKEISAELRTAARPLGHDAAVGSVLDGLGAEGGITPAKPAKPMKPGPVEVPGTQTALAPVRLGPGDTLGKAKPTLHTGPNSELKVTFAAPHDFENPLPMDTIATGQAPNGNKITYYWSNLSPVVAVEADKKGSVVKRYKPNDINFPPAPINRFGIAQVPGDVMDEVMTTRSSAATDYKTLSEQSERRDPMNPVMSALAERIRTIAGNVRSYVIPDHLMTINPEDRNNVNWGEYNPSHHYIAVSEGAAKVPDQLNSTILHEGVHASIDRTLEDNLHIARATLEVARATRDAMGQAEWEKLYASLNPREFLPEAIADGPLRDRLMQIPKTDKVQKAINTMQLKSGRPPTDIRNAWDAVKAIAKDVFKIKSGEDSLFDSVLQIGAQSEAHLRNRPTGIVQDWLNKMVRHNTLAVIMHDDDLWRNNLEPLRLPDVQPQIRKGDEGKPFEHRPDTMSTMVLPDGGSLVMGVRTNNNGGIGFVYNGLGELQRVVMTELDANGNLSGERELPASDHIPFAVPHGPLYSEALSEVGPDKRHEVLSARSDKVDLYPNFAKNIGNQYHKFLGEHIASHIPDLIVYRMAGEDLPSSRGAKPRPGIIVGGQYFPYSHYMTVNGSMSRSDIDTNLVHEGYHGAFVGALERSPKLVDLVTRIATEAKTALAPRMSEHDIAYGFTDPHEMVAESGSNIKLQTALAGVKISNRLANRVAEVTGRPAETVWGSIKNIAKSILGIKSPEAESAGINTALDAMLSVHSTLAAHLRYTPAGVRETEEIVTGLRNMSRYGGRSPVWSSPADKFPSRFPWLPSEAPLSHETRGDQGKTVQAPEKPSIHVPDGFGGLMKRAFLGSGVSRLEGGVGIPGAGGHIFNGGRIEFDYKYGEPDNAVITDRNGDPHWFTPDTAWFKFPVGPLLNSDLRQLPNVERDRILSARAIKTTTFVNAASDYWNKGMIDGDIPGTPDFLLRNMFNKIAARADNVKTYIFDHWAMPSTREGRTSNPSFYDAMGGYIAMNANASFRTLVHEGIHAAFFRAIRQRPDLSNIVSQIATEAATWHQRMTYPFKNMDEFITMSLSQREFQAHLSSIPASQDLINRLNGLGGDRTPVTSLWDSMKHIARKAFGITRPEKNLFDAMMDVGGELSQDVKTSGGLEPYGRNIYAYHVEQTRLAQHGGGETRTPSGFMLWQEPAR